MKFKSKFILSITLSMMMFGTTSTPVLAENVNVSNEFITLENPQLNDFTEEVILLNSTGFSDKENLDSKFLYSIIPGLGQYAMGEKQKGMLFFLGTIIPYVTSLLLAAPISKSQSTTESQYNAAVLTQLTGIAISFGVWVWNMIDAFFMAQSLGE